MKKDFFKKGKIQTVFFLTGIVLPVQSQNCVHDSLCDVTFLQSDNHMHSLKFKDVLLPVAVVGVSAMYVNNGWLTKQRKDVQDVLSAKGKHKIKIDNYMQYSPMVAVYGLNMTGIKGKHSFKDRTIILTMSYVTMGFAVNTMKYAFKEKRPDSNARNSYPSGHTATAFMGAEFLYREYKNVSPWIGYAGYAVAATTGYLRIYNDRHYINDVVAGAFIGVASTKLAYWLYPKIFKHSRCGKNKMCVVGAPYYSTEELGVNLYVYF